MEDKKLNEQESLSLIAQMIQNSKKGLVVGSGNSFLFWGYLTLTVSIAIFVLLYFTGSQSWFWLGSVIPAIGCLYIWWMSRRDGKRTMSYVDKVISNVWQIVGGTCAIIALLALNYGNNIAILPLLLLVLSVGAGITGSVIQEKSFYNCAAFGIAISLGMLFNINTIVEGPLPQVFAFALAIVVVMIIPGHIVNHKAKRNNV